jgi:hypothetical protein
MLTSFYLAILIAALAIAIAKIRQGRRDGEPLGVDPPDADADFNLSFDTTSSSHHDVSTHEGCDTGGHDAGGFDCGSHGGFDGGGHH